MQFTTPLLAPRRLWRLALVVLLPAGLLRATETEEPVAVFAQVFNGYTRTRLPDKSFKPETYAFGEGGCWTRPVKDKAMEEMTFLRVARAVATPLGRLNYRSSAKTEETDLLILVYWGATQGTTGHSDPSDAINQFGSASSALALARDVDVASKSDSTRVDPATAAAESASEAALWQLDMQNRVRDGLDDRNARILGYTEVVDRARFARHMSFAQDILAEVGDNRYFVVLQAYDFKTATKEKKLKPLWTARISMTEHGSNFARALDQMLLTATPYLGRDSGGLRRHLVREGRVELGPLEVIETLPAK